MIEILPTVHGDSRGFFVETYQSYRYGELGLPTFVQDNLSRSKRGVLRGLHIQHPNSQGKLASVLAGEVFDVGVDLRRGSPNFGKWAGVYLDDQKKNQVYIPEGFAHGFLVLSDEALFSYKCSAPYDPASEQSLAWDDPEVGITWPDIKPILSKKDQSALSLASLSAGDLPRFQD